MAAISTGSFSFSTLINEKNALAAYNGLHLNRIWEIWVKSDNSAAQNPGSNSYPPKLVTLFVSYCLFTTFNRVEHSLSPERVTPYARGWFPDPRGPYFYAALFLAVLNAAKFYREANNQPPPEEKSESQAKNPPTESAPTGMDNLLVVASKATPYLMIITNIAVTIIQIRRGNSSAWITLAFTGITFIDTTSWKPNEYRWYLNTVLGYPVAAATIYYAHNIFRLKIIFKLAISNQTLMGVIAAPFEEKLSSLNKWLEETREGLEQRLLELEEESDEESSAS
jgi:hypothetical protein